jgi:indole-3-glycerol phosphate synthase
VATYLDRILEAHRAAAASDRRPIDQLVARAQQAPAARPFRSALSEPGLAVIAEVKRRSPSKGDLAPDLDPAVLAKDYEAGGAACLSVLTDEEFFGGLAADLRAARAAVEIPVLRKDFTVSEADVCDARLMGADAVLLIVAALDDAELFAFRALAGELDLTALVEVHDEAEVDRALTAGADVIGVNQRDLTTSRSTSSGRYGWPVTFPRVSCGSPSRVSAARPTRRHSTALVTTPFSSARRW